MGFLWGFFLIVTFTHPKKKTPIKIKMCPSVIQKLHVCLKPNIILLTIPKFEMNWNWNHT